MEIVKVEGIIIKDMAYGETSKILTLLTRDYGLVNVIAKGCRSTKSKLRGVSGKLTFGVFYLVYKKNGLSTLTAVDVINPLRNILMDIEKISYVSYLLELTEQLMREVPNAAIFDLLKAGLLKINEGLPPQIITNILELKYLDFLGVAPCISECVVCGNKQNIQTISIDSGGYLCSSCYKGERLYSKKMVQLLRMFTLVDLSKVSKIELKEEIQKEINQFLEEYYDRYTGLYTNSKKFLKNLKKVG